MSYSSSDFDFLTGETVWNVVSVKYLVGLKKKLLILGLLTTGAVTVTGCGDTEVTEQYESNGTNGTLLDEINGDVMPLNFPVICHTAILAGICAMLLHIYSLEINFLLKHFQFSNISNQDSSISLPHQ